MLVLGRRLGESILIGDDIKILVVDLNNGRVKLGIEAPENVSILRTELKEGSEETLAKDKLRACQQKASRNRR